MRQYMNNTTKGSMSPISKLSKDKRGEAEGGGLGKAIAYIIGIGVLAILVYFLINPSARDYIKNLPGYGYGEKKNVDEVVADQLVSGVNPCPVRIGKLTADKSGKAFDKAYCIELDYQTPLCVKNAFGEKESIYYDYYFKKTVGEIGLSLRSVATGVSTRIISIEAPYMLKKVREIYSNQLPVYEDMKKIHFSYLYKSPSEGILICKEKEEDYNYKPIWDINKALTAAKDLKGKYSDNKYFIDSIYSDDVLTDAEFKEINGDGLFNLEENMEFVRKLLLSKISDQKGSDQK